CISSPISSFARRLIKTSCVFLAVYNTRLKSWVSSVSFSIFVTKPLISFPPTVSEDSADLNLKSYRFATKRHKAFYAFAPFAGWFRERRFVRPRIGIRGVCGFRLWLARQSRLRSRVRKRAVLLRRSFRCHR